MATITTRDKALSIVSGLWYAPEIRGGWGCCVSYRRSTQVMLLNGAISTVRVRSLCQEASCGDRPAGYSRGGTSSYLDQHKSREMRLEEVGGCRMKGGLSISRCHRIRVVLWTFPYLPLYLANRSGSLGLSRTGIHLA